MRFSSSRITRGLLGLAALATVLVSMAPAAHADTRLFSDHDTLDLSGDWIVTYGYAPGLVYDSSGQHLIPVALGPSNPNGVHFDALGPNAHGGTKYKGYFINTLPGTVYEYRGTFDADTLYDARGFQLVQMLLLYGPDQDVSVWSGMHHPISTEPARVEILGGYAYNTGQLGNFTMVKYR